MERRLGKALETTLVKPELHELTRSYTEVIADSVIDDGLLRDIPVVNTLRGLCLGYRSVQDARFERKVMKFLVSVQELTQEERESLLSKIENDRHYGEKLGETVIDLLLRIDGTYKVKIVAEAFKAYAKGEIGYEELCRVNSAAERALLIDFDQLKELVDVGDTLLEALPQSFQSLVSSGLATTTSVYDGQLIKLSSVGEIFLRLMSRVDSGTASTS